MRHWQPKIFLVCSTWRWTSRRKQTCRRFPWYTSPIQSQGGTCQLFAFTKPLKFWKSEKTNTNTHTHTHPLLTYIFWMDTSFLTPSKGDIDIFFFSDLLVYMDLHPLHQSIKDHSHDVGHMSSEVSTSLGHLKKQHHRRPPSSDVSQSWQMVKDSTFTKCFVVEKLWNYYLSLVMLRENLETCSTGAVIRLNTFWCSGSFCSTYIVPFDHKCLMWASLFGEHPYILGDYIGEVFKVPDPQVTMRACASWVLPYLHSHLFRWKCTLPTSVSGVDIHRFPTLYV